MGRPRKSEEEVRGHRVVAHLTAAEFKELERRAANRDVRVGEAAREILARALKRRG